MDRRFDRREFLQMSMATGAMLLTGDRIVNLAHAAETTNFAEIDRVAITIITDNYYDTSRPESLIDKRFRSSYDKFIHAEHGLSYFVETFSGMRSSSFMLDFGVDPHGVMNNMNLLGITLGKIDGLGLSHGHWDHWGAFLEIAKANQGILPPHTPFYVGKEAFSPRYSMRQGSSEPTYLGTLDRGKVNSIKELKIVEVTNPTAIMPGGYFSGNIERVTDYEKIPPSFLIKRGNKLEPDQFIGEQALMFIVKGKGLVILSGCAHSGIVNAVMHAQKVTGVKQVYAVMGGFHLVGLPPERVRKTISDIKAMNPSYIVPTHCTGYEAITLFQREMPDQFILNTAGTKYVL